ncbi:MAG: hypothetical protein ABFC89_06500 [Methanospirillum sp.]
MRWSLIARSLPVAAVVPLVGYAYAVEVVSPYWPVYPIEWRVVAELGFLVSAFAVLISAVLAAHFDRR